MRRRLGVVSLVLLIVPLVVRAQQQGPVLVSGLTPPLELYLEPLRQQAGIPGMSAAVVQDGEIIWERGFGFQDLAARIRATPDTPYLVGDLTGTLAAAMLLQCVDLRRLELDVPVRKYGVSLPEPDATLRQVLSHTSTDQPGQLFRYAPERFAQLSTVMESCVPRDYRKNLTERILKRFAMKDSVPGTDLQNPDVVPEDMFEPEELETYRHVLQRLAVPYKVTGRGHAEVTTLTPTGITAAGGLVSTVRDLAQFDKALDSDLLLTEGTRAVAWNPIIGADGTALPMGLGWFVQTYHGQRVVWHFGLVPNAYSSLIIKLPDLHLTFILLANSDGLSAPFQLAEGDLSRSLFARLFLRLAT